MACFSLAVKRAYLHVNFTWISNGTLFTIFTATCVASWSSIQVDDGDQLEGATKQTFISYRGPYTKFPYSKGSHIILVLSFASIERMHQRYMSTKLDCLFTQLQSYSDLHAYLLEICDRTLPESIFVNTQVTSHYFPSSISHAIYEKAPCRTQSSYEKISFCGHQEINKWIVCAGLPT